MVTVNNQTQQVYLLKEKLKQGSQEIEKLTNDNSLLALEVKNLGNELSESKNKVRLLTEKSSKSEANEFSLISQLTKVFLSFFFDIEMICNI